MQARRMALAALIALVVGGIGCSGKTSDKTLVFVDPPDAQLLMGDKKKGILGLGGEVSTVVVDPRQERAWREGHIPGAVHIPLQNVSTGHREKKLGDYDVIVVYGEGYADAIAEAMSKSLINLGYADVRTLRGGMEAWRNEGFDVETGP